MHLDQSANSTLRAGSALVLLLILLVVGCERQDECEVAEVAADKSTQAPRPDEEDATFYFSGHTTLQREFVFVHEDGSYDYAERWNFGIPGTDTLPPVGENQKAEPPESERLQEDGPSLLGSDRDDELQATFGWDWKVGCRMHVCKREGKVCCHQHCADGGATGTAYEPPDQFACMNSGAGGRYDYFIEGLRDGGMSELEACN